MTTRIQLFTFLVFLLILSSRANAQYPTTPVNGINQFGFELASTLDDKKSNFLISPLSISMNLGMVANGAKGKTQSEILNAIHCGNSEDKMNDFFGSLMKEGAVSGVEVTMANSIWTNFGEPIVPEFVRRTQFFYRARLDSVNFDNPTQSAEVINAWASDKTRGKIKKIVTADELRNAKVVLANAVYFKGTWDLPFDKHKTTRGTFFSENGETTAEYMNRVIPCRISGNDWSIMIDIPFKNRRTSFMIVLPKKNLTLADFVARIDTTSFNNLVDLMDADRYEIFFPKFKIEYEKTLNSTLENLGIHAAFGDADFSGIQRVGLAISKVLHKTFIEVNEEGAEAAAVTATTLLRSMPLTIKVDRPFTFFIYDNQSQLILFYGAVRQP